MVKPRLRSSVEGAFAEHFKRANGRASQFHLLASVTYAMRVTVFGSTGGTGRLTIRRLLQSPESHTVVAVARTPAALDDIVDAKGLDSSRLIVMKGDLMDPATIAAAVQGADVIVFVAGVASIGQAARQKTVIYSQGGWRAPSSAVTAVQKQLCVLHFL